MPNSNGDLLKVLRRAENPDVDLARLLGRFDDVEVTTAEEAWAICGLLQRLPAETDNPDPSSSRLHAVTGLFQDVKSEEAFKVLAAEGIPELCRIFDELKDSPEESARDDLLFVLKVLAMYRTPEGTERVIQAARQPIDQDSYWWSVVFQMYDEEHPLTADLLTALSEPLPPGFIRVSLLDCANAAALSGLAIAHPFDSVEGQKQLEAWLTNTAEEEFSYAISAAAALPFISPPERNQLLAIALDHPSVEVQLEGAWTAARNGSESGVKLLSRWCLDPNYSSKASRYLAELGLEDAIPDESQDPDFVAMAEMCQWLAHPMEFGRPPTQIDLYDTRRLFWPPTDDERQVWLFKYRYAAQDDSDEDDVGLGMVGSITFALFGETTADLLPVEAYALHCCWELECNGDPRAPEERTVEAGLRILREDNPDLNVE